MPYYCNVQLSCNDRYNCDLGLLQRMHWLIRHRQAEISQYPDESHHSISFLVSMGGNDSLETLYRNAAIKVEQWIQELPSSEFSAVRQQLFE